MCGDCWNAAMGAPAALAAGRFVWVGYRDRLGFLPERLRRGTGHPEASGTDDGLTVAATSGAGATSLADARTTGADAAGPTPDTGLSDRPPPGAIAQVGTRDRLVGSSG